VSGGLIEQASICVDAFDFRRFVVFPTFAAYLLCRELHNRLIANQFKIPASFN
jgi:hypothetical protein